MYVGQQIDPDPQIGNFAQGNAGGRSTGLMVKCLPGWSIMDNVYGFLRVTR